MTSLSDVYMLGKKIVAWPVSWTFFWVGDGLSYVLELNDESERWCNFWYPAYNWCMTKADDLQEWCEGKEYFPWQPHVCDSPCDKCDG